MKKRRCGQGIGMLPPEDSCITQYENKHKHGMRYKGKLIEEPKLWMFLEYAKSPNCKADPVEMYYYFKDHNWKDGKGREISSVETMLSGIWKSPTTVHQKHKKHKKKKWIPYKDQLKDPRWFAFRERVFAMRSNICECCGSPYNINVHHRRYIKGKYAWEYDYKDVVVLCRNCHRKEHNITEEK